MSRSTSIWAAGQSAYSLGLSFLRHPEPGERQKNYPPRNLCNEGRVMKDEAPEGALEVCLGREREEELAEERERVDPLGERRRTGQPHRVHECTLREGLATAAWQPFFFVLTWDGLEA